MLWRSEGESTIRGRVRTVKEDCPSVIDCMLYRLPTDDNSAVSSRLNQNKRKSSISGLKQRARNVPCDQLVLTGWMRRTESNSGTARRLPSTSQSSLTLHFTLNTNQLAVSKASFYSRETCSTTDAREALGNRSSTYVIVDHAC